MPLKQIQRRIGLPCRKPGLSQDRSLFQSFIQNQRSTQLYLTAEDYDPEQHYFPNKKRSEVMGGLPGSSHSLVFGRDITGDFVYFPGVADSYIWTDDKAALDITGDIDVRADIHALDYTTGTERALVAKLGNSGQFSYMFWINAANNLAFRWSEDGTAQTTLASSAPGFTDGVRYQVRVTLDVDTGASDATATFYYRTDGDIESDSGWTTISSSNLGSTTSINAGTDNLLIGTSSGSARLFTGVIARGLVYDGIAGTLVADFHPSNHVSGNRGHGGRAADAYGNTWRVSRGGKPISLIDDGDGNGPRIRFKSISGNNIRKAEATGPDLSGKDLFLWARLEKGAETGAVRTVVGQYGGNNDRVIRLRLSTGGNFQLQHSTDGSATTSTTLSATPAWWGTSEGWIGAFYDHSAGDLIWYDGGEGLTPSWSSIETDSIGTVTLHNEEGVVPITVGCTGASTPVDHFDGDIFQAGIGASTSSLYDYAYFNAALIDRWDLRTIGTVEASSITGEAWQVDYTDSAEDANDPVMQRPFNGDQFMWAEGNAENHCKQTLSAGIANSSVISVRADMQPLDATPSSEKRMLENNFLFQLQTDGQLRYIFNGVSTFPGIDSDAVLPITNYQRVHVRADHDHGAGTVDFYYRYDYTLDLSSDSGWTQLGTQRSIGTENLDTAITGGTAEVFLGDDSPNSWEGALFRGCVIDDGSIVINMDVNDASGDGTTWTDGVTSTTVTIDRDTSGFATAIVTAPVVIYGGNHSIIVPNHSSLETFPFSVAASLRIHDVVAWTGYISMDGGGSDDGWRLQNFNGVDSVYFRLDDGTTALGMGDSASYGYTADSQFVSIGAFDSADQEYYMNGVSQESATTSLTSVVEGNNLDIGALNSQTNEADTFEFFGIAIFDARVTDSQAARIHEELAKL